MVGVTNIPSGSGHLVTNNAGLLKKKTGPAVANQISVGEKMDWGRQWKRKIGYKSIFTAKLPVSPDPRLRPHKFSMYSKHFKERLFSFSQR